MENMITEYDIYTILEYNNLKNDMHKFNNIIYLAFWEGFIDIIDVLPRTLKSIEFGNYYNQILPKLPNTLQYISFGCFYNQVLPELPDSLLSIKFGGHYNQMLSSLPNKLYYISFGLKYNKQLPALPNSLKKLILFTGSKIILRKTAFMKLLISKKNININKYQNLIYTIKNYKYDFNFWIIRKNINVYL